MNLGYIDLQSGDGVDVRIYYDPNSPVGPDQPLIDGPRGYCLDLTNNSGHPIKVTLIAPDGTASVYNVGNGDPVTSGQAKSMTAAQLSRVGFKTRGDVSGFQLQ